MIFSTIKNYLTGFVSLFYPHCCMLCEIKLVEGETDICLSCLLRLPRTNYHLQPNNMASDRFKGKVPFENVSSFIYYNKGGLSQKIVVNIKYKGFSDFGISMGKLAAKEIKNTSSFFDNIDALIPIPLHYQRMKKRGFNQSEKLAEGISIETGIPVNTSIVFRKKLNHTQTKKGRYERWLNTENIFNIIPDENMDGKHLLIIDDVLTTGATIESCVQTLLMHYTQLKISIFTLAITE